MSLKEMEKKTITISSINIINGRYKITDQDNQSYSFFQTKKDGTNSKAYSYYQEMNLQVNSVVDVHYNVNLSQNGQYEYKNVMMFSEASQPETTTPFITAPDLQQAVEQDPKARGMVRHGFATIAYEQGKKLDPVLVAEINKWTEYVMTGQVQFTPKEEPSMPTDDQW